MRVDRLAPGAIAAVEVDGHECVVWRGRSGRLGSAPRFCPHLDHDLTEGYVADDELVCAGHGWAFDGAGHTYKRNEFGRVDGKGNVIALALKEDGDGIEAELPSERREAGINPHEKQSFSTGAPNDAPSRERGPSGPAA